MRVVLNRNSSALFSVHYSAVAAPVLGGRPTDLDGVTLTDAEKKGPEPRSPSMSFGKPAARLGTSAWALIYPDSAAGRTRCASSRRWRCVTFHDMP